MRDENKLAVEAFRAGLEIGRTIAGGTDAPSQMRAEPPTPTYWHDDYREIRDERDRLQAQVNELTEDEKCWRETAEVSSERLQEWCGWANGLVSTFATGVAVGVPFTDTATRDIITGLAAQKPATTDWQIDAARLSEFLETWQEWAISIVKNTGKNVPFTGTNLRGAVSRLISSLHEEVARLTRRQPPKRKRKAKK